MISKKLNYINKQLSNQVKLNRNCLKKLWKCLGEQIQTDRHREKPVCRLQFPIKKGIWLSDIFWKIENWINLWINNWFIKKKKNVKTLIFSGQQLWLLVIRVNNFQFLVNKMLVLRSQLKIKIKIKYITKNNKIRRIVHTDTPKLGCVNRKPVTQVVTMIATDHQQSIANRNDNNVHTYRLEREREKLIEMWLTGRNKSLTNWLFIDC